MRFAPIAVVAAIAVFAALAVNFSQPATMPTKGDRARGPVFGEATRAPAALAQPKGSAEAVAPSVGTVERPSAARTWQVLRRPNRIDELVQVVDKMMSVAGVDPFFGALTIVHSSQPRDATWAAEVERIAAEAKASVLGLDVTGECHSSLCAYHVSAAPGENASKAMRTFGVATVTAADRRGVHLFALYHGPRDAFFLSSDLPAPYLDDLGELLGFAFEDPVSAK